MSERDGGSAFPRPPEFKTDEELCSYGSKGMSLRDWFAGQAMPLIIEKLQVNVSRMLDGSSSEIVGVMIEHNARLAYELADALLAEREKE